MKVNSLIVFGALCLSGCGTDSYIKSEPIPGPSGKDGSTGSTGAQGPQGVQGEQGLPGSAGVQGLPGTNGSNGSNGTNGSNGHNSLAVSTRFTSSTAVCTAGSGIVVKTGTDSNDNSVLDSIEVQTTSVLCDGVQGAQGNTGATGSQGLPGVDATPNQYDVVSLIFPCGQPVGVIKEVLLRLANGTIIASFSDNVNGLNTRLAIIPPGTYQDTDGTHCVFTVHSDGTVTW